MEISVMTMAFDLLDSNGMVSSLSISKHESEGLCLIKQVSVLHVKWTDFMHTGCKPGSDSHVSNTGPVVKHVC